MGKTLGIFSKMKTNDAPPQWIHCEEASLPRFFNIQENKMDNDSLTQNEGWGCPSTSLWNFNKKTDFVPGPEMGILDLQVSSRKVHPGKVKRATPSAIITGAITTTTMAWPWRNELTSFGLSFLICRMRAILALTLCGYVFFHSNRGNADTEDPLRTIVPGGIFCVRHYSKCLTCANLDHHIRRQVSLHLQTRQLGQTELEQFLQDHRKGQSQNAMQIDALNHYSFCLC